MVVTYDKELRLLLESLKRTFLTFIQLRGHPCLIKEGKVWLPLANKQRDPNDAVVSLFIKQTRFLIFEFVDIQLPLLFS
jgi:hypothetical protein